MFLNESKFIAQVKKAYKTIGVIIADHDGQLVVDISNIVVAIKYHDISNKIKGLVMELAGSFPKQDSAFYISKDQPHPQYEFKDINKFVGRLDNAKYAINKLHISPLLYGDKYMLHTTLNKIFGVKKDVFNVVSGYDEISCSTPTGPAYAKTVDEGIYFTNENGIVVILPTAIKESKFIMTLESANIDELFENKDVKKDEPTKDEVEESGGGSSTEETHTEG